MQGDAGQQVTGQSMIEPSGQQFRFRLLSTIGHQPNPRRPRQPLHQV